MYLNCRILRSVPNERLRQSLTVVTSTTYLNTGGQTYKLAIPIQFGPGQRAISSQQMILQRMISLQLLPGILWDTRNRYIKICKNFTRKSCFRTNILA
ncbi:hypothetical protein ALC53_03007 [Atta colombica]|uniref:DCD domain-containing protein n=1 Tax=Atta colombica TaxID=520822 RepID=A0A195BRE1_9HYME|nr:hypothetical protein ALC53_03007 [Atta colombica]